MAEYIDRKAVEEMIENAEYIAPAFGLCGGYCIDDIDLSSIPAADVAPVVHGKWRIGGVHPNGVIGNWKCSVCGGTGLSDSNFCPNCGAKIDLEEWEK